MKQTQTHVWSLAGEEAVSYSLARGKAAAVTRESGEIAAYIKISANVMNSEGTGSGFLRVAY